jgi:hypothetical protein
MRATRFASFVFLGFSLLTACARLAHAQTYIWTDERGVVHAASDPGEVPANQREKAMRDAIGRKSSVTIGPADDGSAPAVPAAPAPSAAPEKTRRGSASAPTTPRSFEGDAPANLNGGGTGLGADPQVTPGRKPDDPAPKKYTGKGLPPPDPGFEWNCATDPEGGPPKCEQFEKKANKRERRAAAREAARSELGITDPSDEFDPEVAKRVDQRAEEEFKKTTPVPTTKAPKHPAGDDDDSGDSESGEQD